MKLRSGLCLADFLLESRSIKNWMILRDILRLKTSLICVGWVLSNLFLSETSLQRKQVLFGLTMSGVRLSDLVGTKSWSCIQVMLWELGWARLSYHRHSVIWSSSAVLTDSHDNKDINHDYDDDTIIIYCCVISHHHQCGWSRSDLRDT